MGFGFRHRERVGKGLERGLRFGVKKQEDGRYSHKNIFLCLRLRPGDPGFGLPLAPMSIELVEGTMNRWICSGSKVLDC